MYESEREETVPRWLYKREVDRLESERADLAAKLKLVTETERVLTCAYCGEAYPPNTPTSNSDALRTHIAVCKKHPLRAVLKQLVESMLAILPSLTARSFHNALHNILDRK